MILKNEQGSALVENVIAMCVLLLLSALVVSTFFGGLSVYTKSFVEYTRVNEVYSSLELMEGTGSDLVEEVEGTMSFEYSGATVVVEGTYFYDKEGEKIGEFVTE